MFNYFKMLSRFSVVVFLISVAMGLSGCQKPKEESQEGDPNNNQMLSEKFPKNRRGMSYKVSKIEVSSIETFKNTGSNINSSVISDYKNNQITRYYSPRETRETLNQILPSHFMYFDPNGHLYYCKVSNSNYFENSVIDFNNRILNDEFKKVRLFFQNTERDLAASWLSSSSFLHEQGYEFTHGESAQIQVTRENSVKIKIKSLVHTEEDSDKIEKFYDEISLEQVSTDDLMIIDSGC